jgi:hypothetical protein
MDIKAQGSGYGNYENPELKKAEFNKLIKDVTKDGIVSPDEKQKIFDSGYELKDEKAFQSLKQGINTESYPEISKIFEEGFDSGMKSESFSKISEEANQNKIEKDIRKEKVSTQNIGRKAAASIGESVDSLKETFKNLGKVNNEGSIIRKAASFAGEQLESAGKTLKDWSLPDDQEKKIASQAKMKAKSVSSDKLDQLVSKKIDSITNNYDKKAAAGVNCVPETLKHIGFETDIKGGFKTNTENLKSITGKDWSASNVKNTKTEDLINKLKGQENKALVTDGAHAYVFKGIDSNTGNIKVFDAIENKNKTVLKNNPSTQIFSQSEPSNPFGKQDKISNDMSHDPFSRGKDVNDPLKNASDKKGEPLPFKKAVEELKNTNPVDKTYNKLNESWEIRKLFILAGDTSQSASVNNISKAVKNNDEGALKKELASKGIKVDDREIKAMISVLGEKLYDGSTMADKLGDLSKAPKESQKNYLRAIEYSNVDLENYFSSASSSSQRAESMLENLKAMLDGRDGC